MRVLRHAHADFWMGASALAPGTAIMKPIHASAHPYTCRFLDWDQSAWGHRPSSSRGSFFNNQTQILACVAWRPVSATQQAPELYPSRPRHKYWPAWRGGRCQHRTQKPIKLLRHLRMHRWTLQPSGRRKTRHQDTLRCIKTLSIVFE
eukprot:UN3093